MNDDPNDHVATLLSERFAQTSDLLRVSAPDLAALGTRVARRRRRSQLAVGGVTLGVAALVLGAVAVVPRLAAQPAHVPVSTRPVPSDPGSLSGVTALAPNDAWAVGSVGTRALVDRWDGSSWTAMAPPAQLARQPLHSVVVLSDDDVWVRGHAAVGAAPLVSHWDGHSWSTMSLPRTDGDSLVWAGTATGSDDVWLAGVQNAPQGNGERAITEHWDGHHWSFVALPAVPNASTSLLALSGTGPDDVWATGVTYPDQHGGLGSPYVVHWDGTSWSRVSAPTGDGWTSLSSVVAVSPTEAWAAGSVGRSGQYRPVLEHLTNGEWHIARLPGAVHGVELMGLAGSGPSDVWLVGYRYESAPGSLGAGQQGVYHALSYHWDGTSWTAIATPSPGRHALLNGVSDKGAGATWAVGGSPSSDSTQLRLQWSGTRWLLR